MVYVTLLYGGLAGLAKGLAGYLNAAKLSKLPEKFDPAKLVVTVVLSAGLGVLGVLTGLFEDPLTSGLFGTTLETLWNKLYPFVFKK